MRGVRTARYSYAKDVNTGERVLFDHHRDPHELVNLADRATHTQVVSALNARTNALVHCAGAACNRTFGRVPHPDRPDPSRVVRDLISPLSKRSTRFSRKCGRASI